MFTVDDCIKCINSQNCFDNDVTKLRIFTYIEKIKKVTHKKRLFNSFVMVMDFFASLLTIIRLEKTFYEIHSDYAQHMQYRVLSELSNSLTNISLKMRDESLLDVWDINPCKSNKYIIFCAGISSEKSSLQLQMMYLNLIRNGFGVITFDYRGRGKSGGEFSRKNAFQDVDAIYNYLLSKGVPSENIGIIGHSIGSGVAADYSSFLKKGFAFTILINPFFSAAKMAKKIASDLAIPYFIKSVIQKLPDFVIPLRNNFDNFSAIKKIKKSVLIIHSKDDKIIPVEQARDLYNKTGNPNICYFELQDDEHEVTADKIRLCLDFLQNRLVSV